jgi:hypothetical protein
MNWHQEVATNCWKMSNNLPSNRGGNQVLLRRDEEGISKTCSFSEFYQHTAASPPHHPSPKIHARVNIHTNPSTYLLQIKNVAACFGL